MITTSHYRFSEPIANQISKFFILFARYTIAILVACFVSAIVFFVPIFALVSLGFGSFATDLDYVLMPFVGFCGVYSGCLCLERPNRRFGSIALLALGLAYYVQWMLYLNYREGENEAHPHLWVVGLAALVLGGLAAVIFISRQSAPTTTPTAS